MAKKQGLGSQLITINQERSALEFTLRQKRQRVNIVNTIKNHIEAKGDEIK